MGEFLSQAAAREAHKAKLRARNPDLPESLIESLTPMYPQGTKEYHDFEQKLTTRLSRWANRIAEERERGKNQ